MNVTLIWVFCNEINNNNVFSVYVFNSEQRGHHSRGDGRQLAGGGRDTLHHRPAQNKLLHPESGIMA